MNPYTSDLRRISKLQPLLAAYAACGVFVALVVAACLIEDARAQPAGQKIPGEDWVQLLNAKDLSGWTPVGAESWTVEAGRRAARQRTHEGLWLS